MRPAGLPPLPKVKQMAMLVDVENYSQLDLYSQLILRELPDDVHANLACAWVAQKFQIADKYNFYLDKVNSSSSEIKQVADDLHIDVTDFVETLSDEERVMSPSDSYHLIKAWGYGFGSEMASLMGQAYLAEVLGRTPIVDWGQNFLYRDGGTHCVFHHYFEAFNSLKLKDVSDIKDQDIYPPKWKSSNLKKGTVNKRGVEYGRLSALYFFGRDERLTVSDYYAGVVNIRPWIPHNHDFLKMDIDECYRYLAKKYLTPTKDIKTGVDLFIEEKMPQGFIAVHARGSDKDEGYRAMTSIPRQKMKYARELLREMPAQTKIFLMTDDEKLLTEYQKEFDDRLVFTESQRSSSQTGVHYDAGSNKINAGKEMLTDMLIAAKSKHFIGLGLSNPSQLIYYFGDFNKENYTLFGENRLKQFNTHLYKTISVV